MSHPEFRRATPAPCARPGAGLKLPRITSLRAKLFLAATVVQALMLVMLTTQSLDLINTKLEERAQSRLDEEKQLLVALLADPLKRGDVAAIESVMSRVKSADGVTYLVLLDKEGRPVARAGWDAGLALPRPGTRLHDDSGARRGRFDTQVAIEAAGTTLGTLHFGVSTAFMQSARDELMREAVVTGGIRAFGVGAAVRAGERLAHAQPAAIDGLRASASRRAILRCGCRSAATTRSAS